MLYINTDSVFRVWPTLQASTGFTLGLEPGEEADIDAPEDFSDPYLKPVGRKPKAEPSKPKTEKTPEPLAEATADADAPKE